MEAQTALAKVTRLLSAAKAWVGALLVAVPGLATMIANWAESGELDGNELRILLVTAALSALVGGGVYRTPAGEAEVEIVPGSIEVPDPDPDSTDIDPDAHESSMVQASDPVVPPGLRPDR